MLPEVRVRLQLSDKSTESIPQLLLVYEETPQASFNSVQIAKTSFALRRDDWHIFST